MTQHFIVFISRDKTVESNSDASVILIWSSLFPTLLSIISDSVWFEVWGFTFRLQRNNHSSIFSHSFLSYTIFLTSVLPPANIKTYTYGKSKPTSENANLLYSVYSTLSGMLCTDLVISLLLCLKVTSRQRKHLLCSFLMYERHLGCSPPVVSASRYQFQPSLVFLEE